MAREMILNQGEPTQRANLELCFSIVSKLCKIFSLSKVADHKEQLQLPLYLQFSPLKRRDRLEAHHLKVAHQGQEEFVFTDVPDKPVPIYESCSNNGVCHHNNLRFSFYIRFFYC